MSRLSDEGRLACEKYLSERAKAQRERGTVRHGS